MKTQNMLRRSSMLFLIVLLGISFTNCKKDKDIVPENEIIGKWKLAGTYYKEIGKQEESETLSSCQKTTIYDFTGDGKIELEIGSGCDEDDNFFGSLSTYEISGNEITLSGIIRMDLSFSGNSMTFSIDEEGDISRYVFTRN